MTLWPKSEIPLASLAGDRKAALEPMRWDIAAALADQLVGIEPWARLGTQAQGLKHAMMLGPESQPRNLCLTLDGKPAGAMVVRDGWLRGPFLVLLAVLPKYQRQGLAQAAMAWWENDARRSHTRNLWLSVSGFNAPALQFYERLGFTQVANLDGLLVNGVDEVLMRKRLTGPEPDSVNS